jgi:sortase B
MKNDTMFGTLPNYENQEYFDNHKNIFFITDNKNYRIDLFAGFYTDSESEIYIFPKTSNTNEELINIALEKSTFKSDVNVTKEDRIITLSTCSYNYENDRYALLGVLREIANIKK